MRLYNERRFIRFFSSYLPLHDSSIKMLKLIFIAIAIRLLTLSPCTAMSIAKRGQVKLCGRMLAETLNLLCHGQYYHPEDENEIERRNLGPQMTSEYYPGWFWGLPSQFDPYAQYARHPVLPPNRRLQRGVVDECCTQSCSTAVLLSYCGTGK